MLGVLIDPVPGRRRDLRKAGFTLIELLVVMAVVGILAGLAIPNLRMMVHRARATEVAGDLEVVRVAVLSYNADTLAWPAETALATIPSELSDYLPEGFVFSANGYQLDFENWSLPGGLPGDPGTTRLIGVSVAADDDLLGSAIAEFLGGAIVFSVGNTHTIVIDRG